MESLLFCQSEPTDQTALAQLWHYCFMEDRNNGFIPWYFQHCFQPETTYVAKTAQGEVLAAIYAPRLTYHCRGKDWQAPYIQGVATAPQARGQGVVGRLLCHTMQELARQNLPFGILKPFDPAFYERTSWQFFADLLKYQLPLHKLGQGKPSRRLTYHFLTKSEERLPELLTIYETWLQERQGLTHFCRRTPAQFRRLLQDHAADHGDVLLAKAGETPVGYLLYQMQGNAFFIREAAYTCPEALQSLLALAQEHASQVKQCLMVAPNTWQSQMLLPKQLAGANIYPFAMGRLLDVQTAFDKLPVPDDLQASCHLVILDKEIPQNQGAWQFSCQNGQSKMQKLSEDGKFCQNALQIEISLLTKVYLGCYNLSGYRNAMSLPAKSKAETAAIQLLTAAFPAKANYFYEYF